MVSATGACGDAPIWTFCKPFIERDLRRRLRCPLFLEGSATAVPLFERGGQEPEADLNESMIRAVIMANSQIRTGV